MNKVNVENIKSTSDLINVCKELGNKINDLIDKLEKSKDLELVNWPSDNIEDYKIDGIGYNFPDGKKLNTKRDAKKYLEDVLNG